MRSSNHTPRFQGMRRNQASLDPRNYGYWKLSDLIDAIGLFELKRENQRVLVRDKRTLVRSAIT